MKSILTIILSFLLIVSGLAQTRNVVVGTNDVIVSPTNFWNANATNARSGLGFSATWLTNTNVTNFRTDIGLGSTNNVIFNNIQFTSASISSGGLSIDTNNATFGSVGIRINNTNGLSFWGVNSNAAKNATRTNLGLGATWLTNTNSTNFRTAIGLGDGENVSIGADGGSITTDDFNAGNVNVSTAVTFTTNSASAITRTNLGLGATWLTNTNVTNFRTEIGLGTTNGVEFGQLRLGGSGQMFIQGAAGNISFYDGIDSEIVLQIPSDTDPVVINSQWNDSSVRSNLGLGWSALTNTNAGTSLVSIDTNGNVVSPTNFWQEAPITTTFIESQPITNSTTNITASRLLHIHSLATNIVNVTNTIVLPINALTFEGDMALVVHKGPTSSLTQVRQAGSSSNIATLNKFNEAVEFTYYNNTWQFLETAAFTAPVYFSGTNTAANVAESRTNLGLGATNTPEFRGIVSSGNIIITNQSSTNNGLLFIYRTNTESFLGLANLIASNNTAISNETLFRVGVAEATNKSAQFGFRSTNTNGDGVAVFSTFGYNALMMIGPSARSQTNAAVEADIYSVSPTNKVATLVDTNTGAFSLHRAIGFRTNETNGAPVSGGNFSDRARWLQIYIGTNAFYIPVFQ